MTVGEALAAFRASASSADRDRLALAIRERLLSAIQRYKLPRQTADDLAQQKVMPVLDALLAGEVAQPDAFVWRAGCNAALDSLRRDQKRRKHEERIRRELTVDAQSDHTPAPDARLATLRRALTAPHMPESYRAVLKRHYLEGVDIAKLAELEGIRVVEDLAVRIEGDHAVTDGDVEAAAGWLRGHRAAVDFTPGTREVLALCVAAANRSGARLVHIKTGYIDRVPELGTERLLDVTQRFAARS